MKAAGLGSRLAGRTFVLFCACAALPIVVFAAMGLHLVSTELTSHANTRLAALSKSYGLLVLERLTQIDLQLEHDARRMVDGTLSAEQVMKTDGAQAAILSAAIEPSAAAPGSDSATPGRGRAGAGGSAQTDRARIVRRLARQPDGALTVTVRVESAGRAAIVTAKPDPSDLWNDDATFMDDARVCVYTLHPDALLHCSDRAERANGAEPVLVQHWDLFVGSRYGEGRWRIQATQPEASALAGLRRFELTLPVAAGLAVILALLFSSIQIRRSHGPLAKLVDAARKIGHGRARTRVRIDTGGEFGALAKAFNRMSVRLERQLSALSAFARIDRLILENPAIDPIVEAILPRTFALTACDVASVVVLDERLSDAQTSTATRHRPRDIHSIRGAIPLLLSGNQTQATMLHSAAVRDCVSAAIDIDGVSYWLGVPLRASDQNRGMLILGWARTPAKHSLSLAARIGRRLSVALANADRERELIKQAYFDSLTGLPNRELFADRLTQELKSARRYEGAGAVFFIDLDQFKNVNDSLGHSAGDAVLVAATKRLMAAVRDTDTLARLGGDEFTIIAPGVDAEGAGVLSRKIIETMHDPIALDGMHCVVGASIGIALYPHDGNSTEVLMRNADTAMYRAKASGRGRAVFFESAMNANTARRLMLEQRLRRALDDEALWLAYQPKVDFAGHLIGFEALARWSDPEGGAISPAEFIPIAEESGLIEKLGDWSLRQACADLRCMRDSGLPVDHVAVNVSMHQLAAEDFPARVARYLTQQNLEPFSLEIEVTESALAERFDRAKAVLNELRSMGVHIAMDDFGTGYSSMSLLQDLPIDVVKIDQSFIRRCATDTRASQLVQALIGVSHALGKTVVAEGVETEAQRSFLREQRCEVLQGYLFGRPVPLSDLLEARVPVTFPRTG